MGTSQADKEKHHDRIVAIAATRVRERGLDGIGVADLMKEVGLTHGGFYRHFGSREDLIDEAVENTPGEVFQQPVENAILMRHGLAPLRVQLIRNLLERK